MYRRIVFAAAQGVSFKEASEALEELGELKLLPKRVWRAAKRIGEERVEECRTAAAGYEKLSLPAQRESPVAPTPRVACVQMDGGRFQERERIAASSPPPEAGGAETSAADAGQQEGFWREYKAGVLLSMSSEVSASDPYPELPATFREDRQNAADCQRNQGFYE